MEIQFFTSGLKVLVFLKQGKAQSYCKCESLL